MEVFHSIVRSYQDGGAFMHPILAVMALGIAIAIERYVHLSLARRDSRRTWRELEPLLLAGRLREARTLAEKSGTALGRILTLGLSRQGSRAQLEAAMEEGTLEAATRLQKRTHYLAMLANVATLLGLLGTVAGLIGAFSALSGVNPTEKATLLSSSISEAMNCTAFGLLVAIPLVMIHAFLQAKANLLMDGMEMIVIKVLNILDAQPEPMKEAA